MKYLFGPVNSRRFGRSLGIDLLPTKICTMNCVYCECGETEMCTDEVKEYVPTKEVIAELSSSLSPAPSLDAITFAGSGEPTLHEGIGDIIDFIKNRYSAYRVVVLTNGSLLWRDDIRTRILHADIIVPSLDAVSKEVFGKINRPSFGFDPEKIIEGLVRLREEFIRTIFLEVFILPGFNDGDDELKRLRDAIVRINPDAVQLNTLDRPGSVAGLRAADRPLLERVRNAFFPLKVDIIGNAETAVVKETVSGVNDVLALIRRRPSTMDDIIAGLALTSAEAENAIDELYRQGRIAKKEGARGDFYYAL